MESQAVQGFAPSESEKELIQKHLGSEGVIVDSNFKGNVILKETQARRRAELISDVEYVFALALKHGDYYLGQATINFYVDQLPENDEELFLNSQAMAVADLKVNNHHLTPNEAFVNQTIALKREHLNIGWNKVSLRYFTPYNTTRVGLHSYVDKNDEKQYLYTQFEAFHCFRVFPCFDQPNLKAKMTLSLTVTKDWVAVSNEKEKRYDDAQGNGKRVFERFGTEWFLKFYDNADDVAVYEFNQTPRISTYLYAVCAGPYRVFTDDDPMYPAQRVFVRESLVENLRLQLVLGVTKTTLDLYQKTFGARYPFSKIDHVMCPDYKYGAMENVGCITYADSIVCSSKEMTIPQLTFFCVVIQHELAHMWFGNLVTMQWWNDLWLNESFATALSYYACSFGGDHVEEYKDESWLHFANYKRWGLNDDLQPSNHNIEAQCESTDVSESLIDGITYGKGASLLKQLIFLMSWETFSAGLKLYFKRHSWTNTTLKDFIQALQDGYDQAHPEGDFNLTKWADSWLRTKGPNKISYEMTQENGKITSFKFIQDFTKFGDQVYRKQNINVGFFDHSSNYKTYENITINDSQTTDVPQLVGEDVPKAVLVNSDDYGFGVFIIDESSYKFYEEHMDKIPTQLNKAVVISQLIVMMREIAYPATRFPKILNQMMEEKNQNLINTVFVALWAARTTFLPTNLEPQFSKDVATFFLRKAAKEQGNTGLQMFCIEKALGFISDKENLELIANAIETGKLVVEGTEIQSQLTPDHKYTFIKSYYGSPDFTKEQKEKLKAIIFESDKSDKAASTQAICDHSLPDPELKQSLWTDLTNAESTDSVNVFQQKVTGFFNRFQQLDLISPYFEKYYDVIESFVDQRSREYSQIFISGLSPAFMARDEDEQRFKALLEKASPEKHFYVQFLKQQLETIDTIRRSQKLCEQSQ